MTSPTDECGLYLTENDLTMSEIPKKRLVSRTEYILRQMLAVSLSIGLSACGFGGVILVLGLPFSYYLNAQSRADQMRYESGGCFDWSGIGITIAWWLCLTVLPVLVIAGFAFWSGSRKSWETVRAIQLINFADTTGLSEVEILVRASDIPPSRERAELLRMAPRSAETPPEELLRATTAEAPTVDEKCRESRNDTENPHTMLLRGPSSLSCGTDVLPRTE